MPLSDQETLQINQALFTLAHSYETRMMKENPPERNSLTLFDCAVLMVIGQFSPIQSKQLVNRMDVAPSTISIYIRRLTKKGLVNMERDPKDHRVWWLRLTEEGQPVFQNIIAGTVLYTRDFLSVLNDNEQKSLLKLLRKTVFALGFTWQ